MSNPNRSFSRRQLPKITLNGVPKGPPSDLQKLAHMVHNELGAGQGFVVLTFPLDGSKPPRYCSNGDRESVMKLLREFVAKQDSKDETQV